jgi:hypothetical protein
MSFGEVEEYERRKRKRGIGKIKGKIKVKRFVPNGAKTKATR